MLDEYLALGGVELGNNARAKAYASCLPCCAGLLKGGVCTALHDATTDWTDAVRQWQMTARNRATNPSFEAAGPTVEMYRNRAPYPGDAPTGTAGWTGYRTSLSNPGGFIRGTVTENAGVQSAGIVGPTGTASMIPVTPGDVWTLTTELRSAKTVAIGLQYYDASGTYISGTQAVGTSVTPGATDFAVSKLVSTVPAGAAYMRWMNFFNQTGIVVGDTMDMRRWTAERGAALGRPFSGYASPDPDLIAAWAGAAGASETILSGVVPATVTSNGSAFASASPVRSTHWAAHGDYSLRIMSKANASYATLVVTGLTAGLTYTFLVTAHLDAPQTGSLHASARSLYTGFDTNNRAQAPNEAGDHPLQVTVVATSSAATVVFYNGSTGTDIWYDDFAVIEGAYSGGYFDGSHLPEGFDEETWRVDWDAATDASMSTLEQWVIVTPAESAEPPYSCGDIALAPWYDQSNPFSQQFGGFYLLSVKGITDGTMTAGVTESVGYGGVIGAPHYATRSVRVRAMLIGCGRAATHYGLAWLKAALGESFCSRHGNACGTSDLEFFIDCPPALDPGETDYAAATAPYRRYLHDVACTSAPIIAEEYETTSGAYVVVVEYILTAESPFVWGQTFMAESTGAVLTAYDDIPFNLMRRPSGEEGDGVPAVVATQYAFNGSAEYGGSASALPTGWARTATNISAGLTDAKSSDIAAVGPNSARVRLLATGTVTDGSIRLYYDVPLGSVPAGSAPSVSIWAAALVFAGTPTTDPIQAEVEWRTASATVSTAPLGQIPVNGGNISAPGLTKPPTATIARIAVTLPNIDAVSGDDIRLYADAFGLTVP